ERDNYGMAQLYRMDLNGGNQRRVTDRNGYEMTPAFSRDGSLAFAGDREGHGLDIFLLDPKNPKDERLLAARHAHDDLPAFSPDGTRMAFVARSDGNAEIYVMKSDGTALVRVTRNAADDTTPQWSCDGLHRFQQQSQRQVRALPDPGALTGCRREGRVGA